ncbi:anti-virulence regulator CigR family protein [Pseudomonadota bacterium]
MSRFSTFLRFFALVAAVLFLAGPLLADKPNKKGASDPSFSVTVTAGISFGDARKLAVDNGLTGYKPLPPGIRKNLARGKPMPPGIAKTRMPGAFIRQLPHHDGYEWQQAGSDLVLVAIGSLIIADVLERVFD